MENNIFTDWLATYFDELTPCEFYRNIFPAGELDEKDAFTPGKYTAIIVEITKERKIGADGRSRPVIKRHTMTDDLDAVDTVARSDGFCLCSPLSYAGKRRTAENARFMYAIAIDLDKIEVSRGKPTGLMALWERHIEMLERVPKPTMIVSSGTGLHLYYVLREPVAMFPDTAKKMQELKRELTRLAWSDGVVKIKNLSEVQQEGIYQGFRVPGTKTKNGGIARAFETGEPVTVEYLNSFVPEPIQVNRYAKKKELTLAVAREKYPEWYERRVINGEPKGVWHISRNVYDWWKRTILKGATVGHRYYCMMLLAMYAQKCGMYDVKHNPNPVTREELEADCYEIMERFEAITTTEDNHFTEADVLDALEAYDQRWITYPRNSIELKSGIHIKENKRNGRGQEQHIKIMWAIRDVLYPDGSWRNQNGRPTKQIEVEDWQIKNPTGTKAQCERETGLSRHTILKYWK